MKTNDLLVYPAAPQPTLPAAGSTFIDPTFGTTILRVTDSADAVLNMPGYSSIYPGFNLDSSMIVYIDGTGGTHIADLDVVNHKVSNKRAVSTPDGGPAFFYWSHVSKYLAFMACNNDTFLWQADFSVNPPKYTKLTDFSVSIPGATRYIGSRGKSDDDNRFQITVGGLDGVFIFDVRQGKAVYHIPSSRTGGVTKGQMDSSGRYLLIGNYLVDSVTDLSSALVSEGHFDASFGMVATFLGCGNGWFPGYRKLDQNGASYMIANLAGPQGPWVDDAHFGLQDLSGEWMTGSYELSQYTIYRDAAGNVMIPPGWVWVWDSQPPNAKGHWTWTSSSPKPINTPFPLDVVYEGEVFQTSLKVPPLVVQQQWNTTTNQPLPVGPVTLPNGKVYATWAQFQAAENINSVLSANPKNRRICKHYSNPFITTDSTVSYWAQPHAIGSMDGRCVMYGSNYGDPKRVDVFIAFIDGAEPPPSVPTLTITQPLAPGTYKLTQ